MFAKWGGAGGVAEGVRTLLACAHRALALQGTAAPRMLPAPPTPTVEETEEDWWCLFPSIASWTSVLCVHHVVAFILVYNMFLFILWTIGLPRNPSVRLLPAELSCLKVRLEKLGLAPFPPSSLLPTLRVIPFLNGIGGGLVSKKNTYKPIYLASFRSQNTES